MVGVGVVMHKEKRITKETRALYIQEFVNLRELFRYFDIRVKPEHRVHA